MMRVARSGELESFVFLPSPKHHTAQLHEAARKEGGEPRRGFRRLSSSRVSGFSSSLSPADDATSPLSLHTQG